MKATFYWETYKTYIFCITITYFKFHEVSSIHSIYCWGCQILLLYPLYSLKIKKMHIKWILLDNLNILTQKISSSVSPSSSINSSPTLMLLKSKSYRDDNKYCILTSPFSQHPLQFLQAKTHFNPCFLHEQRFEVQPDLHLHLINWRRSSGAQVLEPITGVYTPWSRFQPQAAGSDGNCCKVFQTKHWK